MLAIEETEEAHDVIVRSFWTRARAKTLATPALRTTVTTGTAGGARVIDFVSWNRVQRPLRPAPR